MQVWTRTTVHVRGGPSPLLIEQCCCSCDNLVAEDVVCKTENGKTPLTICKDCWDGEKIGGTTGKSIKTSYVHKCARGWAHATPSLDKRSKVKSPPPSDATTPPHPTDFVGKKQIVDFASAVARGSDNVTSARTKRVHGKSQSLNAKTQPEPTIDRKAQQRIIFFLSSTPPSKNRSNYLWLPKYEPHGRRLHYTIGWTIKSNSETSFV